MSPKLASLKEWFPLDEAAEYCTTVLEEDVSEAELIALINQGKLIGSLYLEHEYLAAAGKVLSKQEYRELNARRGGRKPITPHLSFHEQNRIHVPDLTQIHTDGSLPGDCQRESAPGLTDKAAAKSTDDPILFSHELLPDRSGLLELKLDALEPITGVWDLAMVGMESWTFMEPWPDTEIEGVTPYRLKNCLNGIILKAPSENRWVRLFHEAIPGKFHATCDLPKHGVLVIRRDELNRLIGSANNAKSNPNINFDRSELPSQIEALILAHLKYWKNANRNERQDCPKKEDVKAWLMEQGLSAKLADAGSTFAKPDWAIDKGW
ncbi:hypothetical protein LPB19_01215 [Marinobacter salinisoli]|uniref:Uncharacterized protein n=1 Tax=Marinobacter salinisoli TaxID=2769486 RepID=A0ABX7MRZ8_9GAMM|nr:hypothetical protein [Marinobacter salinisoli]QSP95071.1 hypothetical protein LPB19_01215 [Marinobacter salinisoli]